MRCAALLLAIAALRSTAAHADDVPAEARALAARGRASHDRGDYAAAIAAFERAYALAPRPALLFDLGQAYRLAGNCAAAAAMYRRYLETDPSASPNDDRRELARRHLDAVERCHHDVAPIVAAAPAVEVPAIAPMPDGAHRTEQLGIWLALGGGSALAVAAVFALDAHDASDAVGDAYRTGTAVPGLASTADRGQRDAELATGFAVAGGLAAISGAAIYALGRHAELLRRASVTATMNSAEAHLTWQF